MHARSAREVLPWACATRLHSVRTRWRNLGATVDAPLILTAVADGLTGRYDARTGAEGCRVPARPWFCDTAAETFNGASGASSRSGTQERRNSNVPRPPPGSGRGFDVTSRRRFRRSETTLPTREPCHTPGSPVRRAPSRKTRATRAIASGVAPIYACAEDSCGGSDPGSDCGSDSGSDSGSDRAHAARLGTRKGCVRDIGSSP